MEYIPSTDDTKMVSKVVSFDEVVKTSIETFRNTFGSEPDIAACAPGRVNLIGEHVDYNDGFVLPMALPMVTVIVGKKNYTPSTCEVHTCFQGVAEESCAKFDSSNIARGTPKWLNYVKGVMFNFGQSIPGFNAVINSNVPVGGGLSSSAALEVATLTFLEQLTARKIEKPSDKALICQKAEHTFANMPCGIMDQLISVCGQRNRALLIDCRSLTIQQIPFEAAGLAVLICNSNVKHELSSSEYPLRRKQCQQALQLMGLKSYRDATEQHLDVLKGGGADEVLLRRARHVITEIKRTTAAAEALKEHNFEQMGKLMIESHNSLRDDFHVSCHELDILVEATLGAPGVLGTRMTGGGFGGCTVTLLRKESIEAAVKEIDTIYSRKVGGKFRARFFLAEPAEGARLINLGHY